MILKVGSISHNESLCTKQFIDPGVSWPPPDPDRIPFPATADKTNTEAFTVPQTYSSAHEQIQAFNRRQLEDMKRTKPGVEVQRRQKFHARMGKQNMDEMDAAGPSEYPNESNLGEEAWKNSEGERLLDFGVDEEVEFYDEEDIPLGVLMQRNQLREQK